MTDALTNIDRLRAWASSEPKDVDFWINDVAAEIDLLHAQLARAIEALEPFARAANSRDGQYADRRAFDLVTIADLRKARTLRDDLIAARSQPPEPANRTVDAPPQPAGAPAGAIEPDVAYQLEELAHCYAYAEHERQIFERGAAEITRLRSAPPVTEDRVERAAKAARAAEYDADSYP